MLWRQRPPKSSQNRDALQYTRTGTKWVFRIDKNGNIQYMLLTVVGIEKLADQSPRRKTIQFLDILTGEIITMQANSMPEYMTEEMINRYKQKLTPQERENIEDEEKKIRRMARKKTKQENRILGSLSPP